ncbi:cilia- and flagella-associated protein 263 isoform 3-T3 [Anomaloglossus baeobatrachus]|uniref:cilia- and flagella-associated protein 263 isoform X3 n=1 Tax=Anomaloglossus baeobatrachus TaxID=238106 RepID=UPI003F50327D
MAETDAESVRTESGEEAAVSELSPEQVQGLLRDGGHVLSTLKAETDMFEKFYKRLDPKELSPCGPPDPAASPLDFSQATKEEAEIRSSEIKKAKYEFERDVGRAAVSKKKADAGSEKILRYMEEKMLARDSLVDKLRLKNTALRAQKKKLQMQLNQKEEMGEVLNEVDFQQLKIENAQFLERIDERNQDLLQLKLTTGNTLQVLNSYKKKLLLTTLESVHLAKEMLSRNEILQRIEVESDLVEQEREEAESLNKKLRKQLSDYRVPDVLQYVQEKMAQEELEKSVRAWARKVELAELSLRTQRRQWEQAKAARLMPEYGQLGGEP